MRLGFQHSYSALPSRFYARADPTVVANPQLVIFNKHLAEDLGLEPNAIEREAAAMLSGNQLPDDANPIAMTYAGHQFGGFMPRLGDGRAILLGELIGRDGILRDLQLKGAGLTAFSRNGDGRAALGPMLREYLISEAMHALGIPTTRSLAVVTTGEQVFRQGTLPGAVLTRVAASHVRVGTFQYFAARGDQDAIRDLLDYVIARHYPEAREAEVPALAVLKAVAQRQITLIADWMLVGFIHGVMNTDNMAISGETIDYGPCAFMDEYEPKHGIQFHRSRRPVCVCEPACYRPVEPGTICGDVAVAHRSRTRESGAVSRQKWSSRSSRDSTRASSSGCAAKIGLSSAMEGDADLIKRLLATMQHSEADFTLTFRRLALAAESSGEQTAVRELFAATSDINGWLRDWQERLTCDPQTVAERVASMRAVNPAFIPRNHRVEAALNAASERGDYRPFRELLGILQRPYDDQPEVDEYGQPPQPSERVLQTFCGT